MELLQEVPGGAREEKREEKKEQKKIRVTYSINFKGIADRDASSSSSLLSKGSYHGNCDTHIGNSCYMNVQSEYIEQSYFNELFMKFNAEEYKNIEFIRECNKNSITIIMHNVETNKFVRLPQDQSDKYASTRYLFFNGTLLLLSISEQRDYFCIYSPIDNKMCITKQKVGQEYKNITIRKLNNMFVLGYDLILEHRGFLAYDTSIKFIEFYDLNFKQLCILKNTRIQCTCASHRNIIILDQGGKIILDNDKKNYSKDSGDHQSDHMYDYFDIEQFRIISTGPFIQWNDAVAIEYDKESQNLSAKVFEGYSAICELRGGQDNLKGGVIKFKGIC
jgi:hypothetical protein